MILRYAWLCIISLPVAAMSASQSIAMLLFNDTGNFTVQPWENVLGSNPKGTVQSKGRLVDWMQVDWMHHTYTCHRERIASTYGQQSTTVKRFLPL